MNKPFTRTNLPLFLKIYTLLYFYYSLGSTICLACETFSPTLQGTCWCDNWTFLKIPLTAISALNFPRTSSTPSNIMEEELNHKEWSNILWHNQIKHPEYQDSLNDQRWVEAPQAILWKKDSTIREDPCYYDITGSNSQKYPDPNWPKASIDNSMHALNKNGRISRTQVRELSKPPIAQKGTPVTLSLNPDKQSINAIRQHKWILISSGNR